MPNFLYPEAVAAWAKRELAGHVLPERLASPLQVKLAQWASRQEDNARVIRDLPEGAPDWAVQRHACGEAIHHFAPSDTTRQVLHQLVSYLTEMLAVIERGEDEQLRAGAQRVLKSLERGLIGVTLLLQERRNWLAQPARIEELQALDLLETGHLPATEDGQWRECETLKEVHWVGEALGNCLADGYYDDDFKNRTDSGLRLFYLLDFFGGNVLAVVSFFHGELDDFEAEGKSRDARQKEAQVYKRDLIVLLAVLDYAVSPLNRKTDTDIGNRAKLIERTGICGQSDLDEFEQADVDGFRFWYDRLSADLIFRTVNSEGEVEIFEVDLEEQADSGFVAADDDDAAWPIGEFRLISLRRQIDPALFDSARFDRLCRALSHAVQDGDLEGLDLTLFHEFAEDGTYWRDHWNDAIQTQIGHLLARNERVWWVPNPSRRLAYVWYDTGYQDSPMDASILDRMLQWVSDHYERPGFFWNAIADLGVPHPDLRRTASGAPLLEPTIYKGQRVAAEAGWIDRGESSDGGYRVRSRLVDDHWKLHKDSEQWVCWHCDRGPVAGVLVRHRGPKKRDLCIQAPGQDPRGFAELKRAIQAAKLPNAYSTFSEDHDRLVFGKPIEHWMFRKNGQPIAPTSEISGTGFSLGRADKRLYVFDAQRQLVLIQRIGRKDRLIDAAIVGDPQALRGGFPALMAGLGLPLTEKLEPVARQLGYRLADGVLEVIPAAPQMNDRRVAFTLGEDWVEIRYDPEDIPLYPVDDEELDDVDAAVSGLDDVLCTLSPVTINLRRSGALTLSGEILSDRQDADYAPLQEAVRRAANYLGAPLPKEIERVFGLQRQANGQYAIVENEPPPAGWTFVGDGEQSRWMLDNTIASPAVWYCDGKIGCAAEDYERLLESRTYIRDFLAWRDATVTDRREALESHP